MKKFLTLALLAVLFASCSSDDDDKDNGNGGNNSGNTQFSIVGSWVQDSMAYDIEANNEKAIEAIKKSWNATDLEPEIITLTQDFKFLVKDPISDSILQSWKYTFDGKTLEFIKNDGERSEHSVVFISSDRFYLSLSQEESDKIKKHYQEHINGMLPGEENIVIYKTQYHSYYKRLNIK